KKASSGQQQPPQKQDSQPSEEHGAIVAFTYVKAQKDKDAKDTLEMLKKDKTSDAKDLMAIPADLGRIDILVNNAAEQYESNVEVIDKERLLRVFRTNILSYFFITREFHYKHNIGECILDHTATKGAIVAFIRGLSLQLVNKGIRVNGVAPRPIWTPLIPASFDKENCCQCSNKKIVQFGNDVPMKKANHLIEVAPCYVFHTCNVCSSYITGQVLHLMAAS
ncbi:hypothetical protein ES288_A11G308700v1, partial [Gossypium darwinii]